MLDDGLDVLWITAGLGCDGDTISITGHPASPRRPRRWVVARFPTCASTTPFSPAKSATSSWIFSTALPAARLAPFILVLEGSIPDETNKAEGYWAAFGTDKATGQPITTCEWIDRLAPRAWAVVAAGTCATYGGIHAMEGNPTGCMGLPRLSGWDWKSHGRHPARLHPRLSAEPDNLMETLLYLLHSRWAVRR